MGYRNGDPGWRRSSIGDTARLAAEAMKPKAPLLRELVLEAFDAGPATPEEITDRLSRAGHRVLLMSIRPRCSELARRGRLKDSGERGKGEGGKAAIRWRRTTPDEFAAWQQEQEAVHG